MQHHNLCRNLASPSPDGFQMEPDCVRHLSPGESLSSAVTADDPSAPGPSTEWTDEKHSLYLDSLETSFVNQLHNSIALRGCLRKILCGPYSYRAMPTNNSVSVYQDGKRQKTSPKRNNLSLESTADSHIIRENPYIEHLTSLGKQTVIQCHDQEHNEVSSESLNGGESSLKHSIEVSDQNFEEGPKRRAKKRSNRVMADNSNNDQVVPSGNLTTNYASTSRPVSS